MLNPYFYDNFYYFEITMKFIETKKINLMIVSAAIVLAILPVIGLITGAAISPGLFGANYQEIDLINNPDRYWFIIKIEIFVAFYTFFLSFVSFPYFSMVYSKVILYRSKNRIKFFFVMFLGVPILITCLMVFIVAII